MGILLVDQSWEAGLRIEELEATVRSFVQRTALGAATRPFLLIFSAIFVEIKKPHTRSIA